MTIDKVQSHENWYRATTKVKKAIATGYGTTRDRAVEQCIKDAELIRTLQKEYGTK